MEDSQPYPHLFAPFELAGRRLKNRVAHLAIFTMMSPGGQVTDKHIQYCLNRARGDDHRRAREHGTAPACPLQGQRTRRRRPGQPEALGRGGRGRRLPPAGTGAGFRSWTPHRRAEHGRRGRRAFARRYQLVDAPCADAIRDQDDDRGLCRGITTAPEMRLFRRGDLRRPRTHLPSVHVTLVKQPRRRIRRRLRGTDAPCGRDRRRDSRGLRIGLHHRREVTRR